MRKEGEEYRRYDCHFFVFFHPYSDLMFHFGSITNDNIRAARSSMEEVDWKAEVCHGRKLFASKCRSRRAHALRKMYARPYFRYIDIHSPMQVVVYTDESKNLASNFFKIYDTVGTNWTANKNIARMLSVSLKLK
jgi:hypothetical protein